MLHPNPSLSDFPSIYTARQGRHKIFVGMASGVGKTYQMLNEAQRIKRQGKDVVIGLLETHDRPDTLAKAEGLEIVPRQAVNQCGLVFHEMDTDAILARQPQLVLVDELAHLNFSGSQREKRYQDIEVLLSAGIHVYSTVNIQHLESLRETMTRIPGMIVKTHIPDRLLTVADEIVVVDVTPETLQDRLREGKIYPSINIERSVQTVFQRQNLLLLRELALRQVADNVEDARMREAALLNSNLTYCVHERILVCLSTQPNSIQLLQRGSRLANYMNAPLYGLFVSNPEHRLTQKEALYLTACKQLCQDFQGEFLQVDGFDIAVAIAHIAKTHHITQVILGKTHRWPWQIPFRRPFLDRLVGLLADRTDLHIISTDS